MIDKKSFTCGFCGGHDEPLAEWHPLGRRVKCVACGNVQVMVRPSNIKHAEPGQGKPNMSKKERKKFRSWLAENGDEFLNEMRLTLDSLRR